MPGLRDSPSIVSSILACISHHAEESGFVVFPSWRRRCRQKTLAIIPTSCDQVASHRPPALGPANTVRASHLFCFSQAVRPAGHIVPCRAVPRDLRNPNPPTAVKQHPNELKPCAAVG